MYALDYLIYHTRPYGIVSMSQSLPTKLNFIDIIGETGSQSTANES